MEIFEVFSRRTHDDPLTHVGSLRAPDLELALLLARETHFRHGEGAECWIAQRGDLHAVSHPETMGGVGDRSYRRQDGYVGVGAKHKRVTADTAARGARIEGARPGGSSDGH